MEQELVKIIKHRIFDYVESHLKYYVPREDLKKEKQKLIEKTVNLAKQIEDEHKQTFIIAGLLTATDQFIDRKYSNDLKERLKMTKVAKLFEEEKLEAVAEAKAAVEAKAKAEFAEKLIKRGTPLEFIAEDTGLSLEKVKQIAEKMT